MDTQLARCHSSIRQILGRKAEPLKSVELVEQYRRYWRPDQVKTILLAESHVYTRGKDRDLVLKEIPCLPGYPTHYCRFVYCLAYGERELIKNGQHVRRDGTPQYWELLYSCNNRISARSGFPPILKKATRHRARLRHKIRLLQALKQRGIWLVDASIVAVYKRKKKKPKPAAIKKVIRASWEGYTRATIEEARPVHVICVGKGIFDLLESDIRRIVGDNVDWVYQPNSRLTAKSRLENLKKISTLCSE